MKESWHELGRSWHELGAANTSGCTSTVLLEVSGSHRQRHRFVLRRAEELDSEGMEGVRQALNDGLEGFMLLK